MEPPSEQRGETDSQRWANESTPASNDQTNEGLGTGELRSARADAPKHGELSYLLADRGGHPDRDDECTGEEGDDGPGAKPHAARSDLSVVAGSSSLGGFQSERVFNSILELLDPCQDIGAVGEHDRDDRRFAASPGRLLDHGSINLYPRFLKRPKFWTIPDADHFEFDLWSETFDAYHVADPTLKLSGGQRVEQNL